MNSVLLLFFLPERKRSSLIYSFLFNAVFRSFTPQVVQRVHLQQPRGGARFTASCACPSNFHHIAILLLGSLAVDQNDAGKASCCVAKQQCKFCGCFVPSPAIPSP